MTKRFERIIFKLAEKHAPHLLTMQPPPTPQKLSEGLAKRGILVMMGVMPQNQLDEQDKWVRRWVWTYGRLYKLFAEPLFSSLMHFQAIYADPQHPPIIMIEGQASPVINALAKIVVPYITRRQEDKITSSAEFRGIVEMLLERLDPEEHIAAAARRTIRNEAEELLDNLLNMPLKQVALFDSQELWFTSPPPPSTMPEPVRPPQPSTLPPQSSQSNGPFVQPDDSPPATGPTPAFLEELEAASPGDLPSEQLFLSKIPIFFDKRKISEDDSGSWPRPPTKK